MNKTMTAFRIAMQREFNILIDRCVADAHDILLDDNNDDLIDVVIKKDEEENALDTSIRLIVKADKRNDYGYMNFEYKIKSNSIRTSSKEAELSSSPRKERALILNILVAFEKNVNDFND